MNGADPNSDIQDVAVGAQRRQLTVMFCDLVGSTEMAARLDPEETREIIQSYLKACSDCIVRYDGFVAKYMGDGVLSYFGYPKAHENDAERAIYAALAIRQSASRLQNAEAKPLAVRIGIATGLVVVGDLIGEGAAQERSVVGETPNLAARLESFAVPNAIVVSDTTQRLTQGAFAFNNAGLLALKGFPDREQAWEVAGTAQSSGFAARHPAGPSSLIGRERELDTIIEAWHAALSGRAQIVGVVGEPGIGKSRLLYEARQHIGRGLHVWLEGGAAQVFSNTPFHVISRLIRRSLSRDLPLTPAQYFQRLRRSLTGVGMDREPALSLVADLIGAKDGDGPVSEAITANQSRGLTLSVLVDWIRKRAEQWPTVIAIEDLHWADPSSIELLAQIVEKTPDSRLLMIYTSRSHEEVPWAHNPGHKRIELSRMAPPEIRRLIGTVASALSNHAIGSVVSRADGIPLFAEELASLMGRGGEAPGAAAIPSTLSDLLMARLDQLGPGRQVAQVAAVLGTEFESSLLARLLGLETEAIEQRLGDLESGGIMVRRTADRKAYAFRHALIRDAAYEALLKSQRRRLHGRAAKIMADDFPETAKAHPDVLAQHWGAAGEYELALRSWQEGGRAASRRRAYGEAQHSYEEALAALVRLPNLPKRNEEELLIQSALAGTLQITRGYAAPEAKAATAKARKLAEEDGKVRKRLALAAREWAIASSSGDYATASRIATDVVALARADGGDDSLGLAHMVEFTVLHRRGDLNGAEAIYLTGERYFDSEAFSKRPGNAAQIFGNAALNAWLIGDDATADLRNGRIATALSSENSFELAYAHFMHGVVDVLQGRTEAAITRASRAMELSDKDGYPQFAAGARIVLGRANAVSGKAGEGVNLIREGLLRMAEIGALAGNAMYLTWLAEALDSDGKAGAARVAITRALSMNPSELYYRPETLRINAMLTARSGNLSDARACLAQSAALATQTGSRRFRTRSSSALADMGGTV